MAKKEEILEETTINEEEFMDDFDEEIDETNENEAEVKSIWQKVKDGASKVVNSKPVKIGTKIMAGAGILATGFVIKALFEKDETEASPVGDVYIDTTYIDLGQDSEETISDANVEN